MGAAGVVPDSHSSGTLKFVEPGARHELESVDARQSHTALGVDKKKRSMGATERDEEAREQYRERVKQHPASSFVVVDECGSNVNLTPRYARAPRGQRAYGKAPRNTPVNTTIIASMTEDGMGPTQRHLRRMWSECLLLPSPLDRW